MAKRFTDTEKYKKPFLRGLQGAYKLLWDYICSDCNNAGIWIVDFQIAKIYLGEDIKINKYDAIKFFNADKPRIFEIENGSRWFILSFVEFQYGVLNPENRAHQSVILQLKNFGLWDEEKNKIKPLTSPLQGAMDMDIYKDKDMVIEGGMGGAIKKTETASIFTFDDFWSAYGKKIGRDKCEKLYSKISEADRSAIKDHVPKYVQSTPDQTFRKNPQTYLNQKSWNDEIIQTRTNNDTGTKTTASRLSIKTPIGGYGSEKL